MDSAILFHQSRPSIMPASVLSAVRGLLMSVLPLGGDLGYGIVGIFDGRDLRDLGHRRDAAGNAGCIAHPFVPRLIFAHRSPPQTVHRGGLELARGPTEPAGFVQAVLA